MAGLHFSLVIGKTGLAIRTVYQELLTTLPVGWDNRLRKGRKKRWKLLILFEFVLRALFFYAIFDLLFVICSFGGFSLIYIEHTISIEEIKRKLYISMSVQHLFPSSQYKPFYMQWSSNKAILHKQKYLVLKEFYSLEKFLKYWGMAWGCLLRNCFISQNILN